MSNTKQVLIQDTQEYNNLKKFCDILNKNSPNKHIYVLKDIYRDVGADIMWTTIVDITAHCQVLSPQLWQNIVYERESFDVLEKEFFEDKFCQDKK